MLQKLNERIQGLVAWIIISLVALTFMLFGVDYYMQSRHESTAQVDVNGEPITRNAFELSYRRMRQSRDTSQMTVASENQLKQQLLQEMIMNTLSVQSARSNGFEVSSSLANSAIVSIPQFQEDGHFSTIRYTQALNNAFFTPESFQEEVRQGMLLNQQRFALIGTSFALPEDVKQFVKLYMQTRDYNYLQIPASQFITNANISERDIASYYQQHRNEFVAPEQISIEYVRLSIQDIKKTINISDELVKQYYDENKSTFLKPFNEVKAAIREQLLAESAQAKYADKLEKLSDLSYQTPDSLTSVAESLTLPLDQSNLFTRQGGDSLLLKNKQVLHTAFGHDVLELGNNSDPIQLDNDTVVVLRVAKHILAAEKPLTDVKKAIVDALAKKNAEVEATRVGKALLDPKNTLAQQEKLIIENKLKWQDVKHAAREKDVAPNLINELAFSLARVGESTGGILDNGDYVIVALKAITDGEISLLDTEQVNSITQQIEANYGVMDYELYSSGLMSKATIVRH